MVLAIPGQAADFRAGQVEGLFDLTLAYGLGVRLDDVDDDLVAIANGGKAKNANKDDGNLNYKDGIISNAVRLNADLTLAWQNFGASMPEASPATITRMSTKTVIVPP